MRRRSRGVKSTPFSQILQDAALALSHFWNFRTQAEQMSSESGLHDSGNKPMSDPLTGAWRRLECFGHPPNETTSWKAPTPCAARMREEPLCANDVETITRREFTLEGRGRNIAWLCPLSLMEKFLRLLASILRMAVGRRWFRGQKPRRLNLSSGRVDARLRPRTNCGSLSRPNARQAFVEASGQSCAVRGFIRRP